MNYKLQIKIMRALGFAIGSLRGIANTYPRQSNIDKLLNHIQKETDEIMQEIYEETRKKL